MNHYNFSLSLDQLRNNLIRLEDTIIFALIERAQFSLNPTIYNNGAFSFLDEPDFIGSFLDWFLRETEKVHARVRRYLSPDEYPFTDNLPNPILPPIQFHSPLIPNSINLNHEIKSIFINDILPKLCKSGDDGNHGSAATCDIQCLQALSKRIHYGKFIAEAKFLSDPHTYTQLIKQKDINGIMKLLTNQVVEDKLLLRLRKKAQLYGQEIDDNMDTISYDNNFIINITNNHDNNNSCRIKTRIDLDIVVNLYRDFVIPLTKRIEVEYLLNRV